MPMVVFVNFDMTPDRMTKTERILTPTVAYLENLADYQEADVVIVVDEYAGKSHCIKFPKMFQGDYDEHAVVELAEGVFYESKRRKDERLAPYHEMDIKVTEAFMNSNIVGEVIPGEVVHGETESSG